MLLARVALIDLTGTISFSLLSRVAAALQVQVQRDLGPIWQANATVCALPNATSIGPGIWPIFVVDRLEASEGGSHLTRHNQPFARVEYGAGWTLAASHECMEMLVDPFGNRLHASTAVSVVSGLVRDVPGVHEYLLEICDPSGDAPFAYLIDDVTVSDFYTPHYFEPNGAVGTRYSFTGALKRPREVRANGYLSWLNAATGTMQQLRCFGVPKIVDLGAPSGPSLREFVDGVTRTTVALSESAIDDDATRAHRAAIDDIARARAASYPTG